VPKNQVVLLGLLQWRNKKKRKKVLIEIDTKIEIAIEAEIEIKAGIEKIDLMIKIRKERVLEVIQTRAN
jgi:hypothetical protein